MRSNPVILFCVDHNFNTSDKPADYVKRAGPNTNHFDPKYFKAGSNWSIPDLDRSEAAHVAAHLALAADGRKIYDATIVGNLPILEKIQLGVSRRLAHT